MNEPATDLNSEKKRDFITVVSDFLLSGVGILVLTVLISGTAQAVRYSLFQLQLKNEISKLGSEVCSPVIWSAYETVDKDTRMVAFYAFIGIFFMNWNFWSSKPSLRQKQTFGQFLLMVIGYYALVNFIHYFKAQNFLQFALTKCSLPLGQKEMEGAMLAGSYDFLWLIILVSVVFIVVTFFFFWRRIPNPDSLDKG